MSADGDILGLPPFVPLGPAPEHTAVPNLPSQPVATTPFPTPVIPLEPQPVEVQAPFPPDSWAPSQLPPLPFQAQDPEQEPQLGLAQAQAPAPEPSSGVTSEATAQQQPVDAEALAVASATLEHQRQQIAAEEKLAALRESNEAAERNAEAHRQNRASAAAKLQRYEEQAKALAEARIDPERWWSSRTTGQKIAGFLAAAAGGILAPQFGGRNMALESVFQEIDRDIDAQKGALANRQQALQQERGLVAELVRAGDSAFEAAEKARLASLSLVDAEIAAQQARFDPQGTQWQVQQHARLAVQERREAVAREIEDAEWNRGMAVAQLAERQRANRARERQAAAALVQRRAEAKVGQRAKEAAAQAILERKQGVVGFDAQPLRNRDKTPFIARTEKEGQEMRSRMAATEEFVTVLDKLSLLRQTAGAEFGALNSDDRQRMEALAATLTNALRNKEQLGALDEGLLRFVERLQGESPAGYWDNLARWDQTRTSAIDQLNSRLKSQGYTGPRIEIDRPDLVRDIQTSIQDIKAQVDNPAIRGTPRRPQDRITAAETMVELIEDQLARHVGRDPKQIVKQYDLALSPLLDSIEQSRKRAFRVVSGPKGQGRSGAVVEDPNEIEVLAALGRLREELEAKRDQYLDASKRTVTSPAGQAVGQWVVP